MAVLRHPWWGQANRPEELTVKDIGIRLRDQRPYVGRYNRELPTADPYRKRRKQFECRHPVYDLGANARNRACFRTIADPIVWEARVTKTEYRLLVQVIWSTNRTDGSDPNTHMRHAFLMPGFPT